MSFSKKLCVYWTKVTRFDATIFFCSRLLGPLLQSKHVHGQNYLLNNRTSKSMGESCKSIFAHGKNSSFEGKKLNCIASVFYHSNRLIALYNPRRSWKLSRSLFSLPTFFEFQPSTYTIVPSLILLTFKTFEI